MKLKLGDRVRLKSPLAKALMGYKTDTGVGTIKVGHWGSVYADPAKKLVMVAWDDTKTLEGVFIKDLIKFNGGD